MAGSGITPPQTSKGLAASLLEDCNTLLSELAFLQYHLAAIDKPNVVEVRQFKSFVQSELKSLKKLSELAAKTDTPIDGRLADGDGDGDNDDEGASQDEMEIRVLHSLRSSNLPFYSSVWNVAKSSCIGVVAFSKRFYWYKAKRNAHGSGGGGIDGVATPTSTRDLERSIQGLHVSADAHKTVEENLSKAGFQKRSVLVDIVADNGEEWVKVSTVTASRLLFELAKRGWEMGCDSTSEDGEEIYRLQNDDSDDDDDEDAIELVRLATDMKKAAALVRVRYKHPRIRFVLPKIVEGETPEVDAIIKDIRKTGVTVECSTGTEDASKLPAALNAKDNGHHPKTMENILPTLLPNPHPHMTSTLNVDCTLLLALVSDLSHFKNIDPSLGHHPAITRQIELEAKQPLVISELWPAMGDRQLVCTEEAAKRMYEIVETIGTAVEKKRTKIMMAGNESNLNCDREDLISQFQALSDHKVPLNWNIPIRVVNAHAEIERGWTDGPLPPVARIVASQLSDINTSVFLYGWATGLMTISSNRTVAKQIEVLVEENRNGDDELSGPLVWICDTARSLVGKDSNRKA